MAISRSALSFMERAGMKTTLRYPMPRQDIGGSPVHTLPLDEPVPDPSLVQDANGDPSPDRGSLDPWPPPQEV